MVVSESESEVPSDSEFRPMCEHQLAIDGAPNSAQGLSIKTGLIQSDCDKKEVDLKLVKPERESKDSEHNQNYTEPKNHEKTEATGDDINRPLVLEERHSLSIAETKKRRASIYCNEHLFIPKELARSELQQRTRTLSRYSKHREYHLRMLKFPVGSGRPRYVAEQMKKARARGEPNSLQLLDGMQMSEDNVTIKQEVGIINEVHEEHRDSSDLPQNVPDFEAEGGVKTELPDDEEISKILLDLVKKEVDENEALEEMNRKILQSQRQSVIRTNTGRLPHNPYFRWQNPDHDVGLQVTSKAEPEQEDPEDSVHYNQFPLYGSLMEASTDFNTLEERVGNVTEQESQSPEGLDNPLQSQFPNTETINYLLQCEAAPQMQLQQPQLVVSEVPANSSTPAALKGSPAGIGGQSTNAALRQQLMHHIVQPVTLNEEQLQSSNCNNNADDRINQNLGQPQFLETSFPPEISLQWNPASTENYAEQAYHTQQVHLQQQYLYPLQYQQQQKQQLQQQQLQQQQLQQQQQQQHHQQQQHQQQHQQKQLILYHHHQHKIEAKVQEMRLMYQRIKIREQEQLHQYGKSLKKIQEERIACERRHAEEKRVFLVNMDLNRKLEEKLKTEKEQLLRQLRSDLKTLELKIVAQQRQQGEKALAWTWQHQHQQHQLQQLQRQQLLAQQVQSQQQQPSFVPHQQHSQEVGAPQGQYIPSPAQPNQEQYTQQHPALLYDPSLYVYQPAYQESNVYQPRLQPYREPLLRNPADSHTRAVRASALEMPRRLLLPPPPYCPTSNRAQSEANLSSRRMRHRSLNTDHHTGPYAVQIRAPPPPSAPPPAEYLQFPRNPQASATAESSHDLRSNHLEISSAMANYVADFMNRHGDR